MGNLKSAYYAGWRNRRYLTCTPYKRFQRDTKHNKLEKDLIVLCVIYYIITQIHTCILKKHQFT